MIGFFDRINSDRDPGTGNAHARLPEVDTAMCIEFGRPARLRDGSIRRDMMELRISVLTWTRAPMRFRDNVGTCDRLEETPQTTADTNAGWVSKMSTPTLPWQRPSVRGVTLSLCSRVRTPSISANLHKSKQWPHSLEQTPCRPARVPLAGPAVDEEQPTFILRSLLELLDDVGLSL